MQYSVGFAIDAPFGIVWNIIMPLVVDNNKIFGFSNHYEESKITITIKDPSLFDTPGDFARLLLASIILGVSWSKFAVAMDTTMRPVLWPRVQ